MAVYPAFRSIEVPAAQLAARRRAEEDVARLRESIPADPLRLGTQKQFVYNRDFHSVVIEACGNTMLAVAVELQQPLTAGRVELAARDQPQRALRQPMAILPPTAGRLVVNAREDSLQRVLERGCWTPVETFASRMGVPADWTGIAGDGFLAVELGTAETALELQHDAALVLLDHAGAGRGNDQPESTKQSDQ